jgi:hypothetical protein
VWKTQEACGHDATPTGKCNPGEELDSCTGGGNAHGDLTALGGACVAGNSVGVQVICNEQCRQIAGFGSLVVCGPCLNETATCFEPGVAGGIGDSTIREFSV